MILRKVVIPADTRRNNNVNMASNDVAMSFWHHNDVIALCAHWDDNGYVDIGSSNANGLVLPVAPFTNMV